MNAILKKALDAAEKLSPEDQEILAEEMEKRAYELWLDAQLDKGERRVASMTVPRQLPRPD